ncbi:hypothetical protein K3172_04765 [Qipengyuania sp. 6B39]|uniref:hypothetical protein n=1 Tax=Qipengyuania proteolytica TaxID=2867239 RepID=UPI001C892115|nr:hypothetical protein [Qipengyuania proteolytica]MBX7495162.1 hypothetical protein [Qipengyuania proteolytica]
MIPLYRGFDGLDVSFRAQINPEFEAALEEAKLHALTTQSDTCLPYAGQRMLVAASGARGGYAYRVSTGRTGATWFFKKPNPNDPWGVRVSCSSFMLAENGLGRSRAELYAFMDRLGVRVEDGGESIGRVDFAVDILAPELTLRPENFVMHSNANRADHFEAGEVAVNGKSGRVTSVTIGKMPGRQVIVYDKRTEIIAKHKWAWVEIWNASCERMGLPKLDIDDATNSRVWRAELRAGKKHLKEQWGIRSWFDLDCRFGDFALDAVSAVRLTEPSRDSNRSRWQNSQFWNLIETELQSDLFEMRNFAPPGTIRRVHREAHMRLLAKQSLGLLVSRAAITDIGIDDLAAFALAEGQAAAQEIASNSEAVEGKLLRSAQRYDVEF